MVLETAIRPAHMDAWAATARCDRLLCFRLEHLEREKVVELVVIRFGADVLTPLSMSDRDECDPPG